jgi:regulator of RNase E activity RraA
VARVAELLEGFDWSTPFIADACGLLGRPVRTGPPGLRPNVPGIRIAGAARPARHAGSVDVFLEAIAAAQPGDVLVIDNAGRRDEGCIGDLVAGEAHMTGLAGIVCWGAHRDTAAILAMKARVWSLGTCPIGPQQLRPRAVDALTSAPIGPSVATLDDVVFADEDGVMLVASAHVAAVVAAARDIARREGTQAERLLRGELLRSQLQVDAYVARRAADPHYTFREHIKALGGAIEI